MAATYLNNEGVGPASQLPFFDLRNGDVSTAVSLLSKSVLTVAVTTKTLLANVKPFYEEYGGSMNFELLVDAIAAVEAFLPGGQAVPATIPAFVINRESALAFLEDVMMRNNDVTATALGFYEALVESNPGGSVDKTLLQANSLMKLKTRCFVAYHLGRETHGDYRAFKAKKACADGGVQG